MQDPSNEDGPEGIGSSGQKSRMEADKEEENKKIEDMQFKDLKKRIPKLFIDSTHFYSGNKKYFEVTMLTQLFGTMAINSCSNMPALILILILCAIYPFRKKISTTYRKLSFFIMYLIIYMLIFKFLFMTIARIQFIQVGLEEQSAEGSMLVDAILIFFGGIPIRNHDV
jgi:hypothetical protein